MTQRLMKDFKFQILEPMSLYRLKIGNSSNTSVWSFNLLQLFSLWSEIHKIEMAIEIIECKAIAADCFDTKLYLDLSNCIIKCLQWSDNQHEYGFTVNAFLAIFGCNGLIFVLMPHNSTLCMCLCLFWSSFESRGKMIYTHMHFFISLQLFILEIPAHKMSTAIQFTW